MNRLPTVLPEWTRIKWVSAIAEEVWAPRIARIVDAWSKLERSREASIQTIKGDKLADIFKEVSKEGKILLPINAERFVICNSDKAGHWLKALEDSDNIKIGRYLGYPECCIEFFQKVWIEEKYVDTTWPMAMNPSVYGVEMDKLLECSISNNYRNNILLRWIGVKLVSHLPCSFNCSNTYELARRNEIYLPKEELEWIQELLSYPLEWSALHGIAEIKTPILTISTRTDMTGEKYTVRLLSDKYPKEGAKGLVFPFQK